MTRDYHTGGKYPWRHAFRKHLARNPHLWTDPVKTEDVDVKPDVDVKLDVADVKFDVCDVKFDVGDVKLNLDDIKLDVDDVKLLDDIRLEDIKVTDLDVDVKTEPIPMEVDDKVLPDSVSVSGVSGVSVSDRVDKARTIDCAVRENLTRVMRKRSWSGCSDSSYDSDESLQPVEKEFEKFINEVNRKW